MKINRKMIKKIKGLCTVSNLAIVACIIIIGISLFIILKPDGEKSTKVADKETTNVVENKEENKAIENNVSNNTNNDNSNEKKEEVKVEQSKIKTGEEITEKKARKIARKQLKKMGEKIKEEDINIRKIRRGEEEYYYVVTANNTMEIKINGGKITRLNSALVEE